MAGRPVFFHDGSFPGFICALCEAWNQRALGTEPGSEAEIRRAAGEGGLFAEEPVLRDEARARRFLARLEARLGGELPTLLLEAFSSDKEGLEGDLARCIERLWREGASALEDLGDPSVLRVEKAAQRTRREAHRFLGLLRFRELADASLYALIEPDCDILPFIAPHFAARFPSYRWAVEDGRRGRALLHEAGPLWILGEALALLGGEAGAAPSLGAALEPPALGGALEPSALGGAGPGTDAALPIDAAAPPIDVRQSRGLGPAELPLSEGELRIVDFWRSYFEAVAIGERRNPRLQASFMPKKHWRHLPEVSASPGRRGGRGGEGGGAS